MNPIVKLCRPKQWVKNLFVLLPLFFSGNLLNVELLGQSVVAMISFCLISSAIYCFNDYRDIEADRLHPVKRLRPLASGEVSKAAGIALMALLAIASGAILTLLPSGAFLKTAGIILLYFL